MPLFHLSLGSNLGVRENQLARALDSLKAHGFDIERVSSLYETEPVGEAAGPSWFLNVTAAVSGPFTAEEALRRCLDVEAGLGRERTNPGGPRTIDIDLVLAQDQVIEEPGLIVPHPRMHERRFVLAPLAEIAGASVHPRLGLTIDALLARCEDRSRVVKRAAYDREAHPELSGPARDVHQDPFRRRATRALQDAAPLRKETHE